MMLVTVALASPVALLSQHLDWSGRRLRVATGLLSVLFGAWVMIQVGFIDGLFGPVPRWTAH
jgi:hypothetical protein